RDRAAGGEGGSARHDAGAALALPDQRPGQAGAGAGEGQGGGGQAPRHRRARCPAADGACGQGAPPLNRGGGLLLAAISQRGLYTTTVPATLSCSAWLRPVQI